MSHSLTVSNRLQTIGPGFNPTSFSLFRFKVAWKNENLHCTTLVLTARFKIILSCAAQCDATLSLNSA